MNQRVQVATFKTKVEILESKGKSASRGFKDQK